MPVARAHSFVQALTAGFNPCRVHNRTTAVMYHAPVDSPWRRACSQSDTAAPTPMPRAPVPPPPVPSPLSTDAAAALDTTVPPEPPTAYTVSSMYIPKRQQPKIIEIDHAAKRKEREIREIVEAARRVGIHEANVRENIAYLESLLPDLQPNLDKMRASDWVKLVADVQRVASMLIVLKTEFPGANVSEIVRKTPKLLLQTEAQVSDNASKVKMMLAQVDGPGELDAIIETVPNLLDPRQLALSLSNLARWFPSQHPVEALRKSPSMLLNIEEADLPADPTYGVAFAFCRLYFSRLCADVPPLDTLNLCPLPAALFRLGKHMS